jgi:adenylate cyclase
VIDEDLRQPSSVLWRLTALAFADVADYSRLMAADSVGTVALWKRLRLDVLLPHMERQGGRLVESPGDAVLAEFPSVVRAVSWAIDVQQSLLDDDDDATPSDALRLRIGINVDDVIDDDGVLQSDGVNIASRIHQFASPGEIVLTGLARELVSNRLPVVFRDLGTPHLKNIDRPIRIFAVESRPGQRAVVNPYLNWSLKPTLAVLPFRTLGGTEEDAYFGEGITGDIIAGVSRSRSMYLIARSSTLHFGDIAANPQEVANALEVKYLVTGSVRRHENQLRINVELVEVEHLRTIWAEHYDGESADLFDFQDRIVASIVAALEPRVREAETARIGNRPTASLDAYDCVLRALWHLHHLSAEHCAESRTLLERAVLLDPGYAQAHAYLAWCLNFWIGDGHSRDVDRDRAAAADAARRAMALDPEDAVCLSVRGHIMAFIERNPVEAIELLDQALECDGNYPPAWGLSAICHAYLGNGDEARERFRNMWRLSPYDPFNFFYWTGAGLGEFVAGRYEEAIALLRKAYRVKPQFVAALRLHAASLALSGKTEEARRIGQELLAAEPDFRVGKFVDWYPLQRPEDLERLARGLEEAGLPR